MKRLLDVLRPRIESHLKSWSSCIPNGGNSAAIGERLSEVTVTLRAKFRNYMQAVVEKLSENVSYKTTFPCFFPSSDLGMLQTLCRPFPSSDLGMLQIFHRLFPSSDLGMLQTFHRLKFFLL
jgi:hypothetical protein